jgi:hypothetical protein
MASYSDTPFHDILVALCTSAKHETYRHYHNLAILFRGEIPHRDYVIGCLAPILIMLLASFESRELPMNVRTKRFRNIFNTLSALEVVFTILIPWLVILEGLLNKNETMRNGHLLAPHLFIFQTQIAGECMIMLYGERRKWLLFPFTCIANVYRGVTIGTWVLRVLNEDAIGSREIILPMITTGLWIYSSFVFIPKEWYPLAKRDYAKRTA